MKQLLCPQSGQSEASLGPKETRDGQDLKDGTRWVGSAVFLTPAAGAIFTVISNPGQDRKLLLV